MATIQQPGGRSVTREWFPVSPIAVTLEAYYRPQPIGALSHQELEHRGRMLFRHCGLESEEIEEAARAYARTLRYLLEQNGWQPLNEDYHSEIQQHVLHAVQSKPFAKASRIRRQKPEVANQKREKPRIISPT